MFLVNILTKSPTASCKTLKLPSQTKAATTWAPNTLKQICSCSLPDWAAAGKLILGLVVWVARRGLGSGVGVKELPSECYHPSDGPPRADRTNSWNDPKTAFSAVSGGTQQNWDTVDEIRPINRQCQNWILTWLGCTHSLFRLKHIYKVVSHRQPPRTFWKHDLSLRTVFCLENETARGEEKGSPGWIKRGSVFLLYVNAVLQQDR